MTSLFLYLKLLFLNYLNAQWQSHLFVVLVSVIKQLNKNVKCGKEYFTLNVSNIVLVIFKSFITFCWGKKEDTKKKSHIISQSQYFGKKSQLDYFPKSFSPSYHGDENIATPWRTSPRLGKHHNTYTHTQEHTTWGALWRTQSPRTHSRFAPIDYT